MNQKFAGRHYETGTIANWLTASGHECSEAMAFGASGGAAFGYFVFEYKGHLPHVALLTRNTFAPFERALDNLGVRRKQMETTNAKKGEENLRRELDFGHPVVIWADAFGASWNLLPQGQMWLMQPMLVVGHEADGFWVVDQSQRAFLVSADELNALRGKVKKDRFRIMVLEGVEPDAAGVANALETCRALFLDKPPAGSAKNFGLTGMEHFAQMLRDDNTADGWGKKFAGGERFVHAVAGSAGQPGLYDWIARWGTDSAADRRTFAAFLRESGEGSEAVIDGFEKSAKLWAGLAEAALPDSVAEFAEIKKLRTQRDKLRWSDPLGSIEERKEIGEQLKDLLKACESLDLDTHAMRHAMAERVDEIRAVEGDAIQALAATMERKASTPV